MSVMGKGIAAIEGLQVSDQIQGRRPGHNHLTDRDLVGRQLDLDLASLDLICGFDLKQIRESWA